MDFFEAQDRARRRSGRLVALFALALLGTITALYAAAVFIGDISFTRTDHRWWRPELFGGVALFTLLVSGVASLTRWLALRAGGPAVAERVGGRLIATDTSDLRERTLLNVVEEMALASGLPAPAVYVLPGESGINAFAAGYSPADAAVAVTEGALARLSRDELQGVIAHEFSHILNGDMRLNTRLSALVYGILALSIIGRGILRTLSKVRVSGSSRRGKNSGDGLGLVLFVLASGVALLVIGYVGHLFGRLIQAAVSRQREFLADAAAVQFTRNPAGLAGALKRLGGTTLEGVLAHDRADEVSHFCFAQTFAAGLSHPFSTHPPLADRIRALEPGWDGGFVASKAEPPAFDDAGAYFDAPASAAYAFHPERVRIDPAELIGAAGQLSPGSVAAGRGLLAALPDPLREAAHDPAQAACLCLALCLPSGSADASLTGLLELIATRSDPAVARQAARLRMELEPLPADHHLALLQLAAPSLRQLAPAAAATLLDTLDALARADGQISVREFALQKLVTRNLGLAAKPRDAIQVLAPNQVVPELSLALSVAARIEAADERAAAQAFARAAIEFNGIQPPLSYRPDGASTWDDLDLALEHLAHTPAPFRKRVLQAFATALTADSRLTMAEADMLRAFAAALDCPLPPVLPVTA